MISQIMIQPSSTLSEDEPVLQISNTLLKKLNIPQKDVITIKVGTEHVIAKLETYKEETSESVIHLNQLGFSVLKLPGIPLNLQAMYHDDHLSLGPIVAIMTEVKKNDDEIPVFGSIHSFCEELNEYSQKHGGFYYVTNYSRLFSSGFYFHQGKWVEDLIPKPNVVYNRIHSRRLEASARFLHLKKEWKKNNILFFNDRFLSKWEVYSTLVKTDHYKSFLPETAIYHSNLFEEWIVKGEDVYIKPESGSQGRRIIHVYKKNNQYFIEQTSFSKESLLSFSTLQEVTSLVDYWIEKKKFLIQQTIPLLTIEGKRIDFRFLCHKKTFGVWEVTSTVARMSGEGQFVSNIAQGGTTHRPLAILNSVFKIDKAQLTFNLMEELALEVAKTVSNDINGLIGELGIDIGVDSIGKPWLIEVNSKPSKQKESTSHYIRPSAKAICQFCSAIWKERSQQDD